ncbi:MAG: MmgE/PrpD family protein [Escherichia sp.]
MSAQINNIRPEFDREIVDIVDYVMNYEISSRVAYDTAHYCLLDTLGCGLEALEYPACKNCWANCPRHRQRRTRSELSFNRPVQAAFNIGAMIRWLDFHDAWLAAGGGILLTTSAAFWQRRTGFRATRSPVASAVDHETVLTAMIGPGNSGLHCAGKLF